MDLSSGGEKGLKSVFQALHGLTSLAVPWVDRRGQCHGLYAQEHEPGWVSMAGWRWFSTGAGAGAHDHGCVRWAELPGPPSPQGAPRVSWLRGSLCLGSQDPSSWVRLTPGLSPGVSSGSVRKPKALQVGTHPPPLAGLHQCPWLTGQGADGQGHSPFCPILAGFPQGGAAQQANSLLDPT